MDDFLMWFEYKLSDWDYNHFTFSPMYTTKYENPIKDLEKDVHRLCFFIFVWNFPKDQGHTTGS